MQPDNSVKICPDCTSINDASNSHCEKCDKNLAAVKSQPAFQSTSSAHELPKPINRSGEESTATIAGSSHVNLLSPVSDVKDLPLQLRRTAGILSFITSLVGAGMRPKRKRDFFVIMIVLLILLIVLVSVLLSHLRSDPVNGTNHLSSKEATATAAAALPPALNGPGEFKASSGQWLGINDGSFAPFLLGPDGQLKQQALAQLKLGHDSQATSLWRAALHITNNDAEAWIYLENQSVLLSGLPYVTLVAGTDLFNSSGDSDLQGIYVAQHEFNTGNHGFQIRILIANSGTDTNNVAIITRQIINVAKKDKTVVGVISWLTSTENIIALPYLSYAHIPMISPLASSDQLTNASPYFLRIVAPNQIQGRQSALFAEQTLHAKKVVIFVDNNDSYSQNAAQDFEDQFTKDGNTILKIEPFVTDETSKIGTLIQDALKTKPDLLFFTSRDVSDDANFQDALPTSGPFAQLPALAGGAGYVIHKASYGRWYFDADAFPDELSNVAGNSSAQSPFYQDYSNAFNEDGLKPGGYYGYTRPDSYAMLTYDVTSVFLHGLQMVIANNKIALTVAGLQQITPMILAQTLPHVTLQGVSGWIAFDATGNPVNKAIVFLAASSDGHTYMKDWLGCFTQTLCRNGS